MKKFTSAGGQVFDHEYLEPYGWHGDAFFHGRIRRKHVSITPDSATSVMARVHWNGNGAHDLMVEYGLAVDCGELRLRLRNTSFDYHSSVEPDLDSAISEFGSETRVARRAIEAIRLETLLVQCMPKFAEHYARASLEVWRRAEIVLGEVETGEYTRISSSEARCMADQAGERALDAVDMLETLLPGLILAPDVELEHSFRP